MSAQISFLAGINQIDNLAGSGLGFYSSLGSSSAAFGQSCPVGSYQGVTFITSADGTVQGPPASNIGYLNAASGQVNSQTSGIPLRSMTNGESTLNIHFTNSTAVKTQNAYVKIYDRFSVNNPASGVTTQVAELCHPDPVQNQNGSGSLAWTTFSGTPTATGIQLSLTPSPGVSGLHANGAGTWTDTVHDWYLAISASPDSIGSKTQYGMYFYTEYL